jgi:hypothetical protein
MLVFACEMVVNSFPMETTKPLNVPFGGFHIEVGDYAMNVKWAF